MTTAPTGLDTSAVPDYAARMRLDGRSFLVGGAGFGMGRQAAHALAQAGARVTCVDIVGEDYPVPIPDAILTAART
jgi:3-oxoacyl-[acyl-carrier protein] reductase